MNDRHMLREILDGLWVSQIQQYSMNAVPVLQCDSLITFGRAKTNGLTSRFRRAMTTNQLYARSGAPVHGGHLPFRACHLRQ